MYIITEGVAMYQTFSHKAHVLGVGDSWGRHAENKAHSANNHSGGLTEDGRRLGLPWA